MPLYRLYFFCYNRTEIFGESFEKIWERTCRKKCENFSFFKAAFLAKMFEKEITTSQQKKYVKSSVLRSCSKSQKKRTIVAHSEVSKT